MEVGIADESYTTGAPEHGKISKEAAHYESRAYSRKNPDLYTRNALWFPDSTDVAEVETAMSPKLRLSVCSRLECERDAERFSRSRVQISGDTACSLPRCS